MKKVELLAPAGSADSGYAALEYGADAIYLGLPKFSARAEAVNFTFDEFYDTVGYAHHLGRKVYVTLNTLLKESELENVVEVMAEIDRAEADGVIVQDLGVLRLLRQYFPRLNLHASTQMAIHNRAGAEYLLNLGVKRVTLARELDFEEIADIASIEGLQSESFLHGALCYSYSGLCMFSSMQTGRSANRGRCAYSCREVFTAPELDLKGHAFSLRDLSLSQQVDALVATGVDSLKIEGRKKSPLYVAAVVKLYRGLLDRRDTPAKVQKNTADLQTIFSRQTCEFFSSGERCVAGRSEALDTEAVGHRGTPAAAVEKVTRHGKYERISFITEVAFEKHDGIQIDIAGEERPYGFAVNELFKVMPDGRAKPVFTVDAGEKVAVTLPNDHPELPVGAPVYLASSQRLKRELKWQVPKAKEYRRRYEVEVVMRVAATGIELRAEVVSGLAAGSSAVAQLQEQSDTAFEVAKNPDRSLESARKIFDKTGSTPFVLGDFELAGSRDLFLPASLLNKLRRELYEELQLKLTLAEARELDKVKEAVTASATSADPAAVSFAGQSVWIVKVDDARALLAVSDEVLEKIAEVIVEIGSGMRAETLLQDVAELEAKIGRVKLRLALPVLCRRSEAASLFSSINALINAGYKSWQVGNIWGLQALKGCGDLDITGAASLYALNHSSIDEQSDIGLKRVGLSVEDEQDNLRELIKLRGKSLAVTVYQDVPLFIGEACSYSSFAGGCPTGCEEANGARVWEDRRGNAYVLHKRNCRSILTNSQPFSLSGVLSSLQGAGYFQVDFVYREYSAIEIERVLKSFFADEFIRNTHAGNFARELL